MSHFFRPPGAWVGDVIPFADGDELKLFYLHEDRGNPASGTPWHLVTTVDGVTFADLGVALAAGAIDEDDFNAYTGSVVRDHHGTHHLFYTGQNPGHLGADGQPLQLVMHATSPDGVGWERHRDHTFGATPGYGSADWRDPYVFWDEDASVWRMLIAARHVDGPERRRGVIAQCTSTDLNTWQAAPPFWDPRRWVAHECPEVFCWNGWWYLVFSEFSESFTTRYRMSRSPLGPWNVPVHDTLDGRAFYAAKSAELHGRRFFYGWIATREGGHDHGAWQWAGTLSVIEAVQRPDGALAFTPPAEVTEGYSTAGDIALIAPQAAAAPLTLPLRVEAHDGYQALMSSAPLPDDVLISVSFDIEPGTRECGVLLRASADGDTCYVLRLEPHRQRLVFDCWPRARTGVGQWQISGDVPMAVELERPCDLSPGQHRLDVVLRGDLCVATLDRAVVLSTRLYDRPSGHVGVFVGEGSATVRSLSAAQALWTADDQPSTDSAAGRRVLEAVPL